MQTSKKIRPSSRHLFTIGEDLIQDKFAAIMELVKNSYDADARNVTITFRKESDTLHTTVEDDGHGMSSFDVETKWLVPSTSNKVNKRKSPLGRVMQGRKGIGRYASNILGDDLFLSTVTPDKILTEVYVDWSEFDKYDYLDEVEVLLDVNETSKSQGTIIGITHLLQKKVIDEKDWTIEDIRKLIFELKKLLPPFDEQLNDEFNIHVKTINFTDNYMDEIDTLISPFPFIEIFDYRIYGEIDEFGNTELYYENQRKHSEKEKIEINLGATNCGKLNLDIRVYDRDKLAITSLINRGLKDETTGNYLTNLDARRLLNIYNGIGVYRNGFRIRPLGDPENDWLELNKRRVQNPSMRIGSNQTIGYVQIESEENSDLHEQSARDGLKKTNSYYGLISTTQEVLSILEQRRYIYRRKIDSASREKSVNDKLDLLSDYSELSKHISQTLTNSGMEESFIDEVNQLILKEEIRKQNIADELNKSIAIYQGQATLGKIINVIMHEGRRPLHYFKNQIPNLTDWINIFFSDGDENSKNEVELISEGLYRNSTALSDLFSRLDPLATKKRHKPKVFSLTAAIEATFKIFEHEFEKENIEVQFDYSDKIEFFGWSQDITTIFANLIDNSIYWMKDSNNSKRIIILIKENKSELTIDYIDSGTGISKELIENELIFDPEFTTKNEGSGLGLAISGEAAERNNISLVALEHSGGAHFRLSYNKENPENE